MFVYFILQSEFKGSKSAQNFSFQPFDVTSLFLRSDGITYPLSGEFAPTWTAGDVNKSEYSREYFSLISSVPGLGLRSDFGQFITRDMWAKGV